MKKLVQIALLMGFLYPATAQSDLDAYRFSLADPYGSSARSMSLGGALGAVGADPSVVLSNPASLAQYRSSAFNLSLAMDNTKNSASYLDQTRMSNKYATSMPSLNLVFTSNKMSKGQYAKDGWVNYNFGIGYNRKANYNRRISYQGLNTSNSFLDYVSDYVNGLPVGDLDANEEQLNEGFYYFENMFWYAYLIDSVSDGQYMGTYDPNNPLQQQEGAINTSGGASELNFTFAANYEHKLFFGVGVNIEQLNYDETNRFTEIDNPAVGGTWNYFDFTRSLNTEGWGYNGRIGLVFKPTNALRLGLSLHSPSILNLTDRYYDELFVRYDDGSSEELSTVDKQFSYTLVTPMRYGLQAAFFFGKKGFISAEVENIDYSTMSLWADNFEYDAVNAAIANNYQTVSNFKLGGEVALNEFRLRAGLAHQGTPFADGQDYSRSFASFGFGLSEASWGFDLAVVRQLSQDTYVPYAYSGIDPSGVSSEFNKTRIALTLSTKF